MTISIDSRLPEEGLEEQLLMHELFELQTRRTPEKVALQQEEGVFVTYAELDRRATSTANSLRELLYGRPDGCFCKTKGSLGPNSDLTTADGQQMVPICYDKTIDMVVAILAVIKAGACYVPLDPAHPGDRLKAIVEQTQAKVILWSGVGKHFGDLQDQALEARLQEAGKHIGAQLCTLATIKRSADYDARTFPDCDSKAHFHSLAYVLFTSGSTGVPKGIMVEHRNLSSFALAHTNDLSGHWKAVHLQLAAYTFDISTYDLIATLAFGGRLCLVRQASMMASLPEWLQRQHVTHLVLTPSIGDFLITENLPEQLHTFMFGGEAFHPEVLKRLPLETCVLNKYGPTETTMYAIEALIKPPGKKSIRMAPYTPLGKPTGACRVYILRPGTLDLAPVGSVGEICIGGPQVSRGYLGMPELTASKFVADPFCSEEEGSDGARMFRTADFGRMHGDGTIEYLGRMDGQVKLRGLRIETGEIETAALLLPSIKACSIVKITRSQSHEEFLVGFVVLQTGIQTPGIDKGDWNKFENGLKSHIALKLPNYMVPARFLERSQLPLTVSGKVDKRALEAIALQMSQEDRFVFSHSLKSREARPSRSKLETDIARIWADVLGLQEAEVPLTVPFGHIGGDSISAIMLLARLRRNGFLLSTSSLSVSSTVEMLAAECLTDQGAVIRTLDPASRKPLLVLVHPLFGQEEHLTRLSPYLRERFSIIMISDPYNGAASRPASLPRLASLYLDFIRSSLTGQRRVTFGGFSLGGLVAYQMALLWQDQGGEIESLILLDPSTPAAYHEGAGNHQPDLSQFLTGQHSDFTEHYFTVCGQYMKTFERQHRYHGKALYVFTSEMEAYNTSLWWRKELPQATMELQPCSHLDLLGEARVAALSAVILASSGPITSV